MTVYKCRAIKYSVYPEGENPVYSQNVTHVSLDDEGGGEFLVLEQGEDSVRVDPEEWGVLTETINKLLGRDNDQA
jgi:hypothetical protein